MKKIFSCFAFTLIAIAISGCSHTLEVSINRPPQINLGVNRIAVAQIYGTGGDDLEAKITNDIARSGYYKILDRTYIEHALAEQSLTWTDLADSTTAVKLGKIIGAAALIVGRVADSDYSEDEVRFRKEYDSDSTLHRIYERHGTAKYEADLRIVSAETAEILFADHFAQKLTKKVEETDDTPPQIDGFQLIMECRAKIAKKFTRLILPYISILKLKFELDGDIPSLKKGYKMAKAGNWSEALNYFNQAMTSSPAAWKTHWDLALAYQATSQFSKADEEFSHAYKLHSEEFIANQMAMNKQLIEEQEEKVKSEE